MIVTVLGARPQFVKAAVVLKALIEHNIDQSTWVHLYFDRKASLAIARIIKEFLSN